MRDKFITLLRLSRGKTLWLALAALAILATSFSVVSAHPQAEGLTQTVSCLWSGNTYAPGERFYNQVGQLYICNSDGTITYIGTSPYLSGMYNPMAGLPSDSSMISSSPNVYLGYLYGGYGGYGGYGQQQQFPYVSPASSVSIPNSLITTTYPALPYYAQTCQWAGIVYLPGQKFCNSACQEYVCNSDSSIVWTGATNNATCPTCVHQLEIKKK